MSARRSVRVRVPSQAESDRRSETDHASMTTVKQAAKATVELVSSSFAWSGATSFRLIRFFFLTSAVAATAITVAFVLYRQNEIDRLVEFAENQNVALARSFANTIWPRFSSFVASAAGSDRDALRARPEIRDIQEAMKKVASGLPVLKVKIYNLEGLTVYSSEPSEIGQDKRNNPGFLSAAREGKPASKLTYRYTFSSFEGTIQDRDLVESYLPIRQGDGPIEGVFELYTDVTPMLAAVQRPANLMVWLSLMLGVLYGMLFLVVRRADRTIKEQYADITQKNAALQHEVSERKQAEQALKRAHDELEQRIQERTRELTEEIAERKRAEDEARRHRNELAHFGRVSIMGEMATSLAHELNQPLTVISGCAQFCTDSLRAGKGRPEKLLDALEQMAGQADRANKIIRRIRDFIHKEEPERRAVDVNGVIRGVADLLRSDAREHGTEVKLDLVESVPLVMADPIQIQQVILNLAHNGMEAMSDGGSTLPCLTIHTSAPGHGAVEIAVCDEGQGIPAETMDRVFEPFVTTKTHGLGMGLSISRSIVEAHGGRLWATSDGKTGSVFHFTVPVAEGSSSDDR
ncbi:MAG: sensor histidine kinase [Kiloniellaceae bacterium]